MKSKSIFWAILLIAVGLIWQGRNTGYISFDLFRILISWQMLLIALGVSSLFSRSYGGAFALILVGSVFLMPKLGWIERDWLSINWPIILIVVGVVLLIKPLFRQGYYSSDSQKVGRRRGKYGSENGANKYVSSDGYVFSESIFSSVQQIVLDPVFKGARLKTVFGGTVLDLRRTSLEFPETIIDVDCIFGGIEIYLPNDWNLQNQVSSVMGGAEDKRFNASTEIDQTHVLIVRGKVVFGGIEFKN